MFEIPRSDLHWKLWQYVLQKTTFIIKGLSWLCSLSSSTDIKKTLILKRSQYIHAIYYCFTYPMALKRRCINQIVKMLCPFVCFSNPIWNLGKKLELIRDLTYPPSSAAFSTSCRMSNIKSSLLVYRLLL